MNILLIFNLDLSIFTARCGNAKAKSYFQESSPQKKTLDHFWPRAGLRIPPVCENGDPKIL
jgi:hypothetical protein